MTSPAKRPSSCSAIMVDNVLCIDRGTGNPVKNLSVFSRCSVPAELGASPRFEL